MDAPTRLRLPGKFVWFEHQSSALPTARKFYDPLFNWHTEVMPLGEGSYPLILREGGHGIGGYRELHAGTPSQWMSYVSAQDVDASFRDALAAGARAIEPPREFGAAGRGAVLADPTGAVFALWRDAQGDPPDLIAAPGGAWCWNELYTTDLDAASAFYQRVFGYRAERIDVEHRPYVLLRKDGVVRAGLAPSVGLSRESMWLPYVAVPDVDAFARQAQSLGGHVLYGPHDAPGVGRYAIVVDPVGAAIAGILLEHGRILS